MTHQSSQPLSHLIRALLAGHRVASRHRFPYDFGLIRRCMKEDRQLRLSMQDTELLFRDSRFSPLVALYDDFHAHTRRNASVPHCFFDLASWSKACAMERQDKSDDQCCFYDRVVTHFGVGCRRRARKSTVCATGCCSTGTRCRPPTTIWTGRSYRSMASASTLQIPA